MPRLAVVVAILVGSATTSRTTLADGSAAVITGVVRDRAAAWSADGRRIETVLTLSTTDGDTQVRVPGGSVGGVGMLVLHAPPVPNLGARITVERSVASESTIPWVTRMAAGAPAPGMSIADLPRMEATQTRAPRSGAPLYWASGCVFVRYSAEGTDDLEGTTEFDELDASIREWQDRTASCGYLQIQTDEPEVREVGFDRVNLVKFRETVWGRPSEPDEPYSSLAAGLTTLSFIDEECDAGDTPPCTDTNARNGEIIDADIELNAVNFAVSSGGVSNNPQSCQSDLRNTATHELGHLFGLDHTCHDGNGPTPVDLEGNPIPSCNTNNLPSRVTEATMFASQTCGETKKASLEADDVDGFCAIYPLALDPGTCERPSETAGCCTIAPGTKRPAPGLAELMLIALALAAMLAARQRRRSE